MTMATVKKLLHDTLDDLKKDERKRFRSYLKDDGPIGAGKLEDAGVTDIVDIMMDSFGAEEAVKITLNILRKMDQNQLAEELQNKCTEALRSTNQHQPRDGHVTSGRTPTYKSITESAILRLKDVPAADAFIDSAEVAVIGFFETEDAHGYKEFLDATKQMEALSVALCSEKEVWAKYGISSDTISIFRKADLHQEHLKMSEAKKVDTDGLIRFMTMNNVRYVTEYNQASAVGLFQSEVKTHVLLLADRGRADSDPLQERFGDLAPKYSGKMLFVLVDGREKANARVLEYFGLKSRDLPRIGIYDGTSDKKWLMASGEITYERVQNFCDSFLDGELQKQKEAETPEDKTEL